MAPLTKELVKRTQALLKLEEAWTDWVGNPASAGIKGYDQHIYNLPKIAKGITASPQPATAELIEGFGSGAENGESSTTSAQPAQAEEGEPRLDIQTNRPRRTYRPKWFGTKVDAIDHWTKEYKVADEEVQQLRRTGKFDATHAAFVTFENVKDAVGTSVSLRARLKGSKRHVRWCTIRITRKLSRNLLRSPVMSSGIRWRCRRKKGNSEM